MASVRCLWVRVPPDLRPYVSSTREAACHRQRHRMRMRMQMRMGMHRSSSSTILMRWGNDGDEGSAGEEAPETLFLRELRRRGLSKGAAGGQDAGSSVGTEVDVGSSSSSSSSAGTAKPNKASAGKVPLSEGDRDNQRARSMALNSEGVDGLIPRAWELLKLGSSFVLLFWPFMLATIAAFAAAYIYLGASFVHSGAGYYQQQGRVGTPPPYVDAYKLLQELELQQQQELLQKRLQVLQGGGSVSSTQVLPAPVPAPDPGPQ